MKEPIDIDEWLKVALSSIDGMVAEGKLPKEQAGEMHARAPVVRARHRDEGPEDWVDAFMKGEIRKINSSNTSDEEKARLIDEISDGAFAALMRFNGQPAWLGTKSVGEHGKYFADGMTPDELRESAKRASEARLATRRFAAEAGLDLDKRFGSKERDVRSALAGAQYFQTCKTPESKDALFDAMELHALSLSMERRNLFAELSGDDTAMSDVQACACWAKYGFPMVEIEDSQWCASLAATSVHADLAEVIRPPWSTFRVAIPYGILSIDDETSDRPDPCDRMMVMRDAVTGEWTIILEGQHKIISLAGETTAGLCDEVEVERRNISDEPGIALTGRDGRCLRLAARLVLAVCMKMDNRDERPKPKMKRMGKARRGMVEPIVRKFVLKGPIKINVDARPALRSYLDGSRRGAPPTTQALIRGHWKNQPHGPGATERRFIHIEPYWRGPEDAPIAVRPHILKAPQEPTVQAAEAPR